MLNKEVNGHTNIQRQKSKTDNTYFSICKGVSRNTPVYNNK